MSTSRICDLAEAAQAASAAGAWARAVEIYRELSTLAPVAAVFNNLGLVLAHDGRLDDAAAVFRSALAEAPSAALHVNLGNALRRGGDKAAAREAYQQALALDGVNPAAFFNAHAALYDMAQPEPAIEALERALELRPHHSDSAFYLAALLRLHPTVDGAQGRAEQLLEQLPDACEFLRASLRYVEEARTPEVALFADTFDTLRHAFAQAPAHGCVVELGVRRGTTLRFLAELSRGAGSPRGGVHGFDTFEGLPSAWGDQPAGLYTTEGELPDVPSQVTLHRGLFGTTLPSFAATLDGPLRFVHVDCDLYESTREGLTLLQPWLAPGTVIVFDEYLCNPGWQQEERLAFQELALPYRYLAFSLFTKQAAVQLI